MTFIPKVSGVRVEDYDIIPLFDKQQITLSIVNETVNRQETMDYILKNLQFNQGNQHEWFAYIDWDTILKLSILENYPEYEKELINYFGEDWLNHYIRFNH